jgi:hypothetical protein
MFVSLELPFLAARGCALGYTPTRHRGCGPSPVLRLLLNVVDLQPVPLRHEIGDTPFSFERANDGFPPTGQSSVLPWMSA